MAKTHFEVHPSLTYTFIYSSRTLLVLSVSVTLSTYGHLTKIFSSLIQKQTRNHLYLQIVKGINKHYILDMSGLFIEET